MPCVLAPVLVTRDYCLTYHSWPFLHPLVLFESHHESGWKHILFRVLKGKSGQYPPNWPQATATVEQFNAIKLAMHSSSHAPFWCLLTTKAHRPHTHTPQAPCWNGQLWIINFKLFRMFSLPWDDHKDSLFVRPFFFQAARKKDEHTLNFFSLPNSFHGHGLDFFHRR